MTLRETIAGRAMTLVFPSHIASAVLQLLHAERAEFEAVFGGPVLFAEADPGDGPRWIIVEESRLDRPRLEWRPQDLLLISRVPTLDDFPTTLQLLHSLVARKESVIDNGPALSIEAAAERLMTEVEAGFPGPSARGTSWQRAVREHLPDNRSTATVEDLERLVASLGDAHTSVRSEKPVYHPPYAVEISPAGAVLKRVPSGTAAAAAGVQAGWALRVDDPWDWLRRVGAPAHAQGLIAGRRAIALQGVDTRAFLATSPLGEEVCWVEQARTPTPESLLSIDVVARNTVIVALKNWFEGFGIEAAVDDLCLSNSPDSLMVLDLRGNTGGSLLMAQAMRRRFLRDRTFLGTIQFTRADGRMADPIELWDEPGDAPYWRGRLVALTDPLTYSASEDFLHGLQGLEHVTVIGQPSGGGSGRPRTISLLPGWNVTMSSALTFDRNGHCIEGNGIPVDITCGPFTEEWREHVSLSDTSQ